MSTLRRKLFSLRSVILFSLIVPTVALAYNITYNNDKTEAKIFCDNGTLAGTFYWNGSQWSNGVNSGTDIDALAKKQVALNGSACK
jgi:hypothetical protein